MPADRDRAMDARIARAQVTRVIRSFTVVHLVDKSRSVPATGRPPSSVEPRSLALRPRLATGLPWTDDLRMADLAFRRHRTVAAAGEPMSRGYRGGGTLWGGSRT